MVQESQSPPSGGSGMPPWVKWGRLSSIIEFKAAETVEGPAVAWPDIQYSPASTRSATATRASAPAPRSPRPGLDCARVFPHSYSACASGHSGDLAARTRILAGLCDVALVIGGEHHAQGLS